jgi:hypothetical protein
MIPQYIEGELKVELKHAMAAKVWMSEVKLVHGGKSLTPR